MCSGGQRNSTLHVDAGEDVSLIVREDIASRPRARFHSGPQTQHKITWQGRDEHTELYTSAHLKKKFTSAPALPPTSLFNYLKPVIK